MEKPEKIKAYYDIVVKYLLGREDTKDSLIDFVNAVLEDSGLYPVVSVELMNPFNIKEFESDKFSVLDIKAIDTTGRIFDIEIQCRGNETFSHRSLYYWARLYAAQMRDSENYFNLKPVVCINLINFTLFENISKFHCLFLLTEKDDSEKILTDHLQIHFLELPKNDSQSLNTRLQKWIEYFKNEGEDNEIMNTLLKDDMIFKKVHVHYELFTADDKLRDAYEARLKRERDESTILEGAKLKAKNEGREEGIITTAINMKKLGFDNSIISSVTGLSVERIQNIEKEEQNLNS